MAVISSNGSAFLVNEQEKLDFDSVPEYVREPRSSSNSYVAKNCYVEDEELEPHAKSAEIETLWPGISADFLHGNSHQKQPSFYWGAGFVSGIVASVLCVGIVYGATQLFAQKGEQAAHQVVVANGKGASVNQVKGALTTMRGSAPVTTRLSMSNDPDVINPMYATYTVKAGDTLASIAVQAYKRATPRLLDNICRANGMRNANVLSLGQTLNLPQYRPQTNQIASGVGRSM